MPLCTPTFLGVICHSAQLLFNMNVNISVNEDHLSIVGQGLTAIPSDLGTKYGHLIKYLDFSDNNLTKVENLQLFRQLVSLVLDCNKLVSRQNFPRIETLETLWVNSNNIDNLDEFLDSIQDSFPNLKYLSMLKNPCCPNYFVGKDSQAYQKYRYLVLSRIKTLKFLDSTPVTAAEREQAMKHASRIARPDPAQYERKAPELPVDESKGLDAVSLGKLY
jgi:hypothetical protein